MKKFLLLPLASVTTQALKTDSKDVLDPTQICPIFKCSNIHNGGINMDD